MFTLNEHIEYLLMHNDCVIIPGWGAIVARYEDSSYDAKRQIVNKPNRKYGFNPSISHNDGLLAQSIVRREGVKYNQALQFIDRNVQLFKSHIQNGDEVNLGRLGYFKSDGRGHVEFVPFDLSMSNDQYFGLQSIAFAQIENEIAVDGDKKAIIIERDWWKRKTWQTAASVALLLLLSLILTTPIIVHRDSYEKAGLNVASVSAPKHEVIAECNSVNAPKASVTMPNQATKNTETCDVSPLMLDEGGKYYLVIASLNTPAQVNDFMSAHSDVASNVQVVRAGKYYHLAVARSYEPKRLYNFMSELPKGYQAWVYNKN